MDMGGKNDKHIKHVYNDQMCKDVVYFILRPKDFCFVAFVRLLIGSFPFLLPCYKFVQQRNLVQPWPVLPNDIS